MDNTGRMLVPPLYTVTPPSDDPPNGKSPTKHRRGSRSRSPSPGPKLSRSIQDLLRSITKKVTHSKSRRTSCLLDVPGNGDPDKDPTAFRTRSRSLDDGNRKPPSDCETTYRIYDQILQQGMIY